MKLPTLTGKKKPGFDGLARHLIFALVLFSALLTTLITAIELYSDYRRDIAGIDDRIQFIRESYLPALVESVWVADSQQITTQLEGLERLQDIEHLAVSIDGENRWAAGKRLSKRLIISDIPLVRSYRGRAVNIGTLHIEASVDDVIDRLWDKLLLTLTGNMIKTFLVAAFMLYVLQRLAGRHLEKIAGHLRQLGRAPDSSRPLHLDRPPQSRWQPDVLDDVVSAVNLMHGDIHGSRTEILSLNTELEQRVAERTRDLMSAKIEAERANAAKSEFLSRMSHELRTPLNAVIGFGQLLESDPQHPLTAEQIDNVREILRAGNHLLVLVNEVLDLSRIESGRLEVNLEAIAIGPLIQECVAQIQPLAAKRGITVAQELNTPGSVQADPVRLREVLLNLLSNAVKYNRERGAIQVRCNLQGQRLRITVHDTGRGIEAAAFPRLFKPFERMESAYDGIQGAGIGLALTKKLVEAMHGEIGVESEPGAGSRFWFELPLAAAGEPPIESRHRLLYIEDNAANLRLVQKIIATRQDIELVAAASAETGLAIASEQQPALILMDINLRGMDGFEALRQLRANPLTQDIAVVAVTANAMQAEVKHGRAAGFNDYLTKPLDVELFLKTIQHYLPEQRGKES